MFESSSLAFLEIHEPPTLKLVTFVNAFSISFLSDSVRVKDKVTEQTDSCGDSLKFFLHWPKIVQRKY